MFKSKDKKALDLSVEALTNILKLCVLIGDTLPDERKTTNVKRSISTIKGISQSMRENLALPVEPIRDNTRYFGRQR